MILMIGQIQIFNNLHLSNNKNYQMIITKLFQVKIKKYTQKKKNNKFGVFQMMEN